MMDNTAILEPLEQELWRTLEEGGRLWNHREGTLLHQFGVRCARVAEVHYRHSMHGYDRATCEREAASRYPLPPKKVLREEPIPGTGSPLFRCVDGVLEVSQPDGGWDRATAELLTAIRINHFHDLANRPYREEPQ